MNMVHAAKEDKILKWLVKYDSNLLLFHHRFPTSTVNVARAAHPFSTKKYFDKGKTQYILVHNGVIRNAKELQKKHAEEYKIKYQSMLQDGTFNDSEALLWEFALQSEGKKKEMEAAGGIAFVALRLVDGELDKLHFGRNSSPLNMYRDKHGIALSSEGPGEAITPNKLYSWNYKHKRLTDKQYTIAGYVYNNSWQNKNYDSNRSKDFRFTPSRAYNPGPAWAGTDNSWQDDGYEDGYQAECESCFRLTYACVRHDLWGENRYEVNSRGVATKIGDWVGNHVRSKMGDITDKQIADRLDTAIKAAEDDKKQKRLTAQANSGFKGMTAEQILILRRGIMPGEEEIQTEYMAYLASSRGHFEQAYWAMEVDYEEYENTPDTVENIRKRVVLEKVLEKIQSDPEYNSEDAVSSIWRSIWQQQLLKS